MLALKLYIALTIGGMIGFFTAAMFHGGGDDDA